MVATIKAKENPAQNGRNVQGIVLKLNGDFNLQSFKNA